MRMTRLMAREEALPFARDWRQEATRIGRYGQYLMTLLDRLYALAEPRKRQISGIWHGSWNQV